MEKLVSDRCHNRKKLGRIRCLRKCIECLREGKPFPKHICYIPNELQYNVKSTVTKKLFKIPDKKSEKVAELQLEASKSIIVVSGNELCNDQGLWAQLLKHVPGNNKPVEQFGDDQVLWLLLQSSDVSTDGEAFELSSIYSTINTKKDPTLLAAALGKTLPSKSWLDVVDFHYSVKLAGVRDHFIDPHVQAVEQLRTPPPNWTFEHDEKLSHFLHGNKRLENSRLGSIQNCVEYMTVSSFGDDSGVDNLTDGEASTFWESNGSAGDHWIRLYMKNGVLIKSLSVTLDTNDDNYMPYHIHVFGGELSTLQKLGEATQNISSGIGISDLLLLSAQSEFYPIIEIRVKDCKDDGIDTRVHAVKLTTLQENDFGLSHDKFKAECLVRYPKLENFGCDVLYRRALLLQRFIVLLDSVLSFIVPEWKYTIGSYKSLQVIRQLLMLSEHRIGFIENCLKESQNRWPTMPKLYINRRAAAEHKADPSLDPHYKQSIFYQIYEGLKPKDNHESQLTYRWSGQHEQWWECKFIFEGIIDQGGGFRDSLCDLAEEMCPNSSDDQVPLPFFIRTPNHNASDSNINRDMYIPNPSCSEFCKYEWIGQLMGACLRGKECIVLSLPIFVWKKLTGEAVTWSRDFTTVDDAEVKLLENMRKMDEASYEAYFGNERTWTTVLSDKTQVPVKKRVKRSKSEKKLGHSDPDSDSSSASASSTGHSDDEVTPSLVSYEDRLLYASLVERVRMHESKLQIAAIRRGLLKTIPRAVLDLITWQELERRVCGNPEISVEALKRSSHYEDVEESDARVKYMWAALTAFSNEDRSRFLRFVTGRRRLPAPLYLCPARDDRVDSLPESSTCSNTLFLPHYTSEKIAMEKIRYASYNCIAIDTDMSPWDE